MTSVRELALGTNRAYKEFLRNGTTELKNRVILTVAEKIEEKKEFLMAENRKDLENGRQDGLSDAFLDRLELNDSRISGMAGACETVAALTDPVGRVYEMNVRPEGFKVGKMRAPIGVIGIIYEARPNVTIETAILCLKSGNGVILRGGSGAFHSNRALVSILKEALKEHDVNSDLISYIQNTDRESIDELVTQDDLVHLIIPRGGEGLIRSVVSKSRIPVLKHYKGVCHVYVSEDADINMALNITENAKIQRTAVCNSLETLLVDRKIASGFIPEILERLTGQGVEIRGCGETKSLFAGEIKTATEEDWYAEYLDKILAVKIVAGLDEAVDHINQYGSGHTETIVTKSIIPANEFINRVDSSSVIINASTRLADGGVYGLGAEIGISTDRLHARGPMGLEELTTYKWIVHGDGHLRE